MKKSLIILAAIAFSLVSCSKEIANNTPEETPATEASIVFELTANHPDGTATKAVKTGWENGDVIYVFFNNVAAPKYLKMSYDGTDWSTTQMNGATEESLGLVEDATGSMRAVYLPFGNTLTVGADGTAFSFSETTYSYYLTATLDYTVTGGKVSGAFDMAVPDGYIQFFLDDASASSSTEIELREPHLTPQGIASIAADGTITHTTVASGAPLKGYVYDKAVKETGESKGYLFSGILAAGARSTPTDYDFTVVSGGWEGTYYAKTFAAKTWYRGETAGRALKMPALSGWTTITDYKPIDLGTDVGGKRIYWAKCNLGASTETEYGDYFAWGETTPKASFKWSNYAWGSAEDDLTKYCWDKWAGRAGYTDALTKLELADDAAYAVLGGKFRMPTSAEIDALKVTRSNTIDYNWTWCDGSTEQYNGTTVKGWKIVKNASLATLFLPAAGYYSYGDALSNGGINGLYWSSSLDTMTDSSSAFAIRFSSSGPEDPGCFSRYYGLSVRPVSE